MWTKANWRFVPAGVAFGLGLGLLTGCGSQERLAEVTAVELPHGPTTGTARLVARVLFEGTPPVMAEIRVGGDPTCVSKHRDEPLRREDIVVNPDGTLRDVVVRVVEGIAPARWDEMIAPPQVINQDGCRFEPHVSSITAGQAMEFRNADATIHNVNGQPRLNAKFNFSMINERVPPRFVTFAKAEWPPVQIRCDVHPWMKTYVAVVEHPFHSTTGTTGTAVLSRLPAGSYKIEAWHRVLGTATQDVDLTDGQELNLEFVFREGRS